MSSRPRSGLATAYVLDDSPKQAGVLVRSPELISHTWRELVSSRRVSCCFSLALRLFSKKNLNAARPSEHSPVVSLPLSVLFRLPYVSSFFLFLWRCRFCRVFFVPLPFSLCLKKNLNASRPSFSFLFANLVTTGWIFDISLCGNSINQFNSIHRSIRKLLDTNG